jgi:Gene product 88
MNFKELFEGAEPKLPGAPKGVSIMTPDQFLAKSAKGEEPGPEEDVDEGYSVVPSIDRERYTERPGLEGPFHAKNGKVVYYDKKEGKYYDPSSDFYISHSDWEDMNSDNTLHRIRELSGLDEATKLSAPQRDFGDEEFQDYMKRTVGTPDIDKKTGQVKVDKKGKEKYVSGKLKTDKYKLPYIHRSSAIKYYSPEGKRYDPEQIKAVLKQRPKKLLKQNEKMKHSNGELEQFFNIGFAALVGIALDENTNNLIIVNTCPGAGSCKIDCFAMGGGKIQYEAPWQSDGKILTYLLNDPDGFFNQLSSEITKEESDGKKGGYKVSIRWHDAGDFFSPEYMDLAFKLADKFPDVDFYAYTKMAGAALGAKPKNFIINWSEGAHTSQEKQVKANDPNLEKTKNSRIVPDELFQDLLVKNEKGNLIKGASGQWQVQPDKLAELKQRLAKEYSVSTNSILSYDEWEQKTNRGKKEVPVKYNVIVAPGEPDLSANSHGVLGTFLLKH